MKGKPPPLTLPGPPKRPTSFIDSLDHGDELDKQQRLADEKKKAQEKMTKQLTMQSELREYGDFNDSMFTVEKELGHGNGGSVELVTHNQTKKKMARKLIHLDINEEVYRKILLELNILKDCNHSRVVAFYGSYQSRQLSQIRICMEYMDGGSLDKVIGRFGKLPESIVGAIAAAVVEGLYYIKIQHNIIHRDIKPSNILCSTQGDIKLCDFGVSGQLVNSIAQSFVGTRSYMAPERIMADQHGISSDIWSLGLSLMELGYGTHPFPRLSPKEIDEVMHLQEGVPAPNRTVHVEFVDILTDRVHNEAPKMSSDYFSHECCEFIDSCVKQKPDERPTINDLLESPFVKHYSETVSVKTIATFVEKTFRK